MTQSPGQGNALDNLLTESRTFPPSDEFAAQANAQTEIYESPVEDLWEGEARERVAESAARPTPMQSRFRRLAAANRRS